MRALEQYAKRELHTAYALVAIRAHAFDMFVKAGIVEDSRGTSTSGIFLAIPFCVRYAVSRIGLTGRPYFEARLVAPF